MTPEEKAAYIVSQSVATMVEAMGMQAENQYRLSCGDQLAYDEGSFQNLLSRSGISHNDVMSYFNNY